MNHKIFIFLSLASIFLSCKQPSSEFLKVYFREDFSHYPDKPPHCNDGLGIFVDNVPWLQISDATCPAKIGGMFFKDFQPSPAAPNLKKYDIQFSFRFNSKEASQIRAVLRLKQGKATAVGNLDIFADRVVLSIPGFTSPVQAESALSVPLPQGVWNDFVAAVRDGYMRVYLSENRVFKQALELKIPPHTFAGLNFEVIRDAPFTLTNIVVRDPAPLPDNSVARLLSAPRRMDEAAFTRGERHEVSVTDWCGATLRAGMGNATATLELGWTDGTQTLATFGTSGVRGKRYEIQQGEMKMMDADLPDAFIRVTGLREANKSFDVHIRPLLRRYHSYRSYTDAYHDIVRDWELLPSASAHPLLVEARRTPSGTDIYLDGSLAASFPGKTLGSMVFDLTDAASIGGIASWERSFDANRYLPLDVASLGMAKAFADARTSLAPGFGDLNGVPMLIADGANSGDVGLAKEGQGEWGLDTDEYLARSPFDGFLTELHFLVPGGTPYTRAWALCAADPDPAKDPVLTVRLAGYLPHGTGNNRIADSYVALPRAGEKPGPGITQVGTVVTAKGVAPLYLVEIPLHGGRILDLMMDGAPLNFEFFGKPWENFQQRDNTCKPDPRSTSAVQIFGVTLEKSSLGLAFEQWQPANVFHNDEKPGTTAVLTAFGRTSGRLVWDVVDVFGSRVSDGSSNYGFAAKGETHCIAIPLDTPELGWYGLHVRLENEDGSVALEHQAAFARLGYDTRKAHYDSPFGVWEWDGAHNTPNDLAFTGPVMEKAGIRAISTTKKKAEDLEKYRLFKSQLNMPFSFRDFETPEDLAREAANPGEKTKKLYGDKKERFDKLLAENPHVREVLIFHESGPGDEVPPEALELPYKRPDATVIREKRYADMVNLVGPFFRRYYPRLKTLLGNHNCSASNVAAVFRHGGKEEYIDFIGNESGSQVLIPEKLSEVALQGHHIAMDAAEVLTGRRIPATGCYEFTYRAERDMGELQQAEWYVRDALISLAHRYISIAPGTLFDVQNAYHNTHWGGSGLMRRGPAGYPKPSYVAYAVLTDVMDQVVFSRQIPTGSRTVYAVEFKRADGRYTTAFWAARGDVDFSIDFGAEAETEVIGMFGTRQRHAATDGRIAVKAGTSPAYILSAEPIASVSIARRTFPKDERRADASKIVVKLSDAAGLEIVPDARLDTPLDVPLKTTIRKAGYFRIETVQDAEQGACVEIALQTDLTPELNKYFTEYTTLTLKKPVKVPGRPVGFGATVKGDSNWGRVMYIFEDAKGETWRSIGSGGWGCDILDWPGNAAVNFDGWSFVALPLTNTTLFNDHSPGYILQQWVSDGGDKMVDFPVKLTGLIVEMNRQPLELLNFTPSTPVIRIKDVRALYEPEHR